MANNETQMKDVPVSEKNADKPLATEQTRAETQRIEAETKKIEAETRNVNAKRKASDAYKPLTVKVLAIAFAAAGIAAEHRFNLVDNTTAAWDSIASEETNSAPVKDNTLG